MRILKEVSSFGFEVILEIFDEYILKLIKDMRGPSLETIENFMRLSPMILQALWDKNKKFALLQLPHLNEGHLRHFVTKKVC